MLTSLGIVTALAFFAWRGWYVRYLTDDYCTSGLLKTLGFFDAMVWQRQNWSGRFSYFPLKAIFESFGSATARVTPSIMMVLLFTTAFASLRVVFRPASRLALAAVSLALVFATFDSSPSLTDIDGTIYWETGSVTYLPPLMLFSLWIALFASRVSAPAAYVLSGLMMFVAGGMSETTLAAQGAMTGGALLAGLLLRQQRAMRIAASGFAATFAALLLVATAPGNAVRAQSDVEPRPILEALALSLRLANDFLGTYTFASGLSLLTLVLVTFVFAASHRRFPPRISLSIAAIAIFSYAVSFFPSTLLLETGPPERVLDVPNFFVIVTIVSLTLTVAARVRELSSRPMIALATAAVLLLYVPLASIRATLDAIPDARRIARKIDEADRILAGSRGEDVALKAPWAISMRIFHPQPTHWTSRCVSRYYGLNSFHVTR